TVKARSEGNDIVRRHGRVRRVLTPEQRSCRPIYPVMTLLEDISYGIAELLRVLQHAEVTDVRENDELRSRDGPRQVRGVLRLDSLIVRAINDGGSHRNPLQLRRREIRLLRPHGLD